MTNKTDRKYNSYISEIRDKIIYHIMSENITKQHTRYYCKTFYDKIIRTEISITRVADKKFDIFLMLKLPTIKNKLLEEKLTGFKSDYESENLLGQYIYNRISLDKLKKLNFWEIAQEVEKTLSLITETRTFKLWPNHNEN